MTSAYLDAAAAVVISWLLTYAIHSTILLVVAAVAARRLADQHAWLDVIWKTALIAPLVTATLQFDPIALPLGGRWSIPSVTTMSEPTFATPAVGKPMPVSAAVLDSEAIATPTQTVERVIPSPNVDRSIESNRAIPVAAAGSILWPSMVLSWPSIAALAWLVITVVVVVRYGIRLRGVYQALNVGEPVTAPDLLDTIDALRTSANQRHAIRLTTNSLCPVPLALAGRHIVLPERFVEELDPEQQRAALAHELAHVARRDPQWRIAADLIERALFFQPLNRLARARLCDSAEFLCDEWAVQQTQSPLALARCLSVVASWWSLAEPGRRRLGEGGPAGVSAMARSDSAMVRRVTRILNEPARIARPRLLWLAIPVALVAVAAPRVTATQLPAAAVVTPEVAAVLAARIEAATEQREPQRDWTPADIAAARAQVRVIRPARPGASLEERWREALADAARQRFGDFWIVYTFNTPTYADGLTIADSHDGSILSSDGRLITKGPPLSALFNPSAALPLEGGNLAVLLHHRSARADAIDRAGYRSTQLGFDFGKTPVFWLGDAPESESLARVQSLFGQTRIEQIQTMLIELASVHANTDAVLPFLTGLVDRKWPSAIRSEAAEGFEHHHDPRSVEILLRVARSDPDSSVRSEAAETIGEVQTPQSIPALTDLVSQSTDPEVRREAAEGFGTQPADRAIPAIEAVVAASEYEDVAAEAVEALGEIEGPGAVEALTRIAWEHQDIEIQREAVETLGDRHDDAGAMTALERIAREHPREGVQAEAIETIGDHPEQGLPLLLDLAVSGRSALLRREALESIGESIDNTGPPGFERALAVIERAIFDDPDVSVRVDALDALENLPDERALRVLRDVIARHPDARVRREAEEHVRERRQ